MKPSSFTKYALLLLLPFLFSSRAEAAGCGHHLGAGVGIVHTQEPSATSVSIGAEYECRVNPFLGVGTFVDHAFSDPSITLIGIPQILLHPLGGAFFIAGSPLFQFGGYGTHVGSRFSTRLPIPLALFVLVPSFAVDFIGGHRNYWLSLGISI